MRALVSKAKRRETMRSIVLILGILFTILSGVILENRAQAQTYVDIDLFYQELSPYGGWSPHPEFGDVWQPYEVGPDWKPYADGRWEWSDQGWIWISYEPWGWATYHYGRWVYDDYQGWIWIPGTTWAPAWVSWHQSPEYIGWAPLPPDRGFFVEIGINFNIYNSYYYRPYRYGHRHKRHRYYHDYYYDRHNYRPPARHAVFLPFHRFGHHKHAGQAAIPAPEHSIVLRNSRNITNIQYSGNKVINYGPNKNYIEKRSNRKLVKHNIVDRDNIALRGKKKANIVTGNTYNAYRPKIQRKTGKNPFIKTKDSSGFKRSNQVNKKTPGSSVYHNYGQYNKTGVNTNLQEKNDIQNRKRSVLTNPGTTNKTGVTNRYGVSNKIGNRGGSNITREKTYNHNQQQSINRQPYKTSPNSNAKNKFNQESKQQKTSRLIKSGNTPKVFKPKANKFSHNRQSAVNKNSPQVKSYNKSQVRHNKKIVNKSNQKTNKSNYSTKNKSASSGNVKAFQRPSYSTINKASPSSNARSFSKR